MQEHFDTKTFQKSPNLVTLYETAAAYYVGILQILPFLVNLKQNRRQGFDIFSKCDYTFNGILEQ